jgi:hypothetical protein
MKDAADATIPILPPPAVVYVESPRKYATVGVAILWKMLSP